MQTGYVRTSALAVFLGAVGLLVYFLFMASEIGDRGRIMNWLLTIVTFLPLVGVAGNII